jgi:GntR family transcriptional regulator of arabinose operon
MKQPTYIWLADQIKAGWLNKPEALPGTRLPAERQLQAHFGVSRATVSKAMALLSKEGLIRTKTGSGAYVNAIPTASRTARMIGYISPYNIPKLASRHASLALRLYHGMERRAQETGHQILIGSANLSIEREEALVEQFVQLGAEGIIIFPVDYPGANRLKNVTDDYLAQRWRETPIVLMDSGAEEWQRPTILFDNYRLGYEMTSALLQHERRNILFMHTAPERMHNAIHDRKRGWTASLTRAGIPIPASYRDWPVSICDYGPALTETDVAQMAQSLLQLDPRPDAVIAWEDLTAMQLTLALQNQGVSVPQEICVTGFDNLDMTRFFPVPFPTSNPDFIQMGELAVDILDRMIAGEAEAARTYVLPVPLLWREPSQNYVYGDPEPEGGERTVVV